MATAATLNADTLEQQLLEVIELISRKQVDTAKNPEGVIFITSNTRNNLTGLTSISLSIPTVDTIDATSGGSLVIADAVYSD